ncbi:MAG: META domain-containing protein [Methylobacteriaceae bacterium]|nr:META domain-containing protein [Methylobacteriaceae bacterium]
MMRWSAGAVCLAVAIAAAGSAEAQSARRGRGNQDQQQSGQQQVTKKEEKRFPLGQAWIAVSLNNKPLTGGERPSFMLDEQFRVQGFGGCNSFSAVAYPLRDQGIAVGPLALTKRNCDKGVSQTEQAFLMALRTSAKWDTVVGSLVMKGPNGEIKFERSL